MITTNNLVDFFLWHNVQMAQYSFLRLLKTKIKQLEQQQIEIMFLLMAVINVGLTQ